MNEEEKIQEMIEQAVARAIAPLMKPKRKVLLSREAVCVRLKRDKSTLCRWAKTGYLPVSARIGGKVYYDEEMIERFEAGEIVSEK